MEPPTDAEAAVLHPNPEPSSTKPAPAAAAETARARFSLKGGYLSSSEDGFDDGVIINGAWMRPLSDDLASEVEVGYMDASGSHKGVDRDVWAIPILANLRAEPAPGGQAGGLRRSRARLVVLQTRTRTRTPGASVDASGDGFLFAGDAYFGVDIRLGESFRLGLEGKYYATDNSSDLVEVWTRTWRC
jgi:hypothetical protein